jgi:hypothetical protein
MNYLELFERAMRGDERGERRERENESEKV